MNTQQVTMEWIYARSYSPNMKENDSSPCSSVPFLVPHEWSTELEALLMAFLSLLSHCLKWRLGSILLYDKKEKEKQRGPQILIDDLYSSPSRNTPIALCIILRAQHLVPMTNSLARCDFSGHDLDAWVKWLQTE